MIKLWRDYTRFVSNKTMVIVDDKKLLWQGKVLLQECQTYARYVMNSGPELCLFFIWRFLSPVLCNFLHGSSGIKKLQVAQSQIYSQIGQFSRILVRSGASAPSFGLKIHQTSWIFSLWFPAFIKTNYVDNYLRFHALKPSANIKPTVHREFVEF